MATLTISKEDEKRVKGMGFLSNKGTDNFSGRVITKNGKVTAKQLQAIAAAAEEYGDGHVVFTTRLTAEVTGIPYEKIDAFKKAIEDAGMSVGGTGPRVRPVVSCKGTTCQYGLIDAYALSEEIHERFYVGYRQVLLPHKFKIAVGGCPNSCVKPSLNDVGIVGKYVKGSEENGYRIFIGGRWGKKISHGRELNKVFLTKEEALNTVEKVILFFREQGIQGERLSQTIDRIGFEKVEAELLADDILGRKQQILEGELNK